MTSQGWLLKSNVKWREFTFLNKATFVTLGKTVLQSLDIYNILCLKKKLKIFP